MLEHAFGHSGGFDVASLGQLSSVGVTEAQEVTGAFLTFQVTASDIDTNAVVRFEGSLDGSGFFNLAAGETDYTITEDGVYGYVLFAPVKYVRARLVGIEGGEPTISVLIGQA